MFDVNQWEKNGVANGAGGHDLHDRRRGKYNGDKPTWGMCTGFVGFR
jgi:hypothetical protein